MRGIYKQCERTDNGRRDVLSFFIDYIVSILMFKARQIAIYNTYSWMIPDTREECEKKKNVNNYF